MKLSEMKAVLADRKIQLTRSLGQSFLHDGNVLSRIVTAARLTPPDRVLEIGPGLGPLTDRLLESASEVLAVELDARLVEVLKERYRQPTISGNTGRLTLEHADALAYLRRSPRDWTGWKLVANLPYSVASPVLVELAQALRGPDMMVATLQWEVAKRLMAGAGDDDYGVLTLLVQLTYKPGEWFRIPAECFFPVPEVESACVCLARREPPFLSAAEYPRFARVVKRGFSQRRKMLFKLLKSDWPIPALEEAFERLRLDRGIRAEKLSLADFVELTRLLS